MSYATSKLHWQKNTEKKSKSRASSARVNFKNGTIIEMLFLNVNMTWVEVLFLLYLQEKFGVFFSYNLHLASRVSHLWRKITWLIWNLNVFKMAAKIEFSKNYKKISFEDISEISPKRDITCHKETIENLKNRGSFPESCPLMHLSVAIPGINSRKALGSSTISPQKLLSTAPHLGQ